MIRNRFHWLITRRKCLSNVLLAIFKLKVPIWIDLFLVVLLQYKSILFTIILYGLHFDNYNESWVMTLSILNWFITEGPLASLSKLQNSCFYKMTCIEFVILWHFLRDIFSTIYMLNSLEISLVCSLKLPFWYCLLCNIKA